MESARIFWFIPFKLRFFVIHVFFYFQKELPIPWRLILTSSKLWAVICTHAASSTLFIFYLAYLPAYIMTFGINLKDVSNTISVFQKPFAKSR